MENKALLLKLVSAYNAMSYTHHYIFGFAYKGNIYMAYVDESILPAILKLVAASRGQGMALRYMPNAAIKLALLPMASVLCSKKYFEELVENTKYNRGEIFEKLVTENFGQTWVKDNVPFTKGGDVTHNGIAYQVKYEKATFINEKTLNNMTGRA